MNAVTAQVPLRGAVIEARRAMRELDNAVKQCCNTCYGGSKQRMLARITELTGFTRYAHLKENPDTWQRVIEALTVETATAVATTHANAAGAGQAPRLSTELRRLPGLIRNESGKPVSNVANAVLFTQELLRERLRYDTFTRLVLFRPGAGEPWRPWTDSDGVRLQALLQASGLATLSNTAAVDAAEEVAHRHEGSALAEWLEDLEWDGERRLTTWMSKVLGAPLDRYHVRVGRNWLLAMVARALKPGCKVDEVVVLEGEQGVRKTSAFEVLGGEYFRELTARSDSKDFEQQLNGVWLGEFSELAAIKRPEDVERIKQFITNRVDHYRPSFGRATVDRPRQIVFCGSTNQLQWAHDRTGARRFMPVRVAKVDLGWLRANREQLFAEAVALYKANRKWWVYPKDKTRAEQAERMIQDPWDSAIEVFLHGRSEVSVQEVLGRALGIAPRDQTAAHATRVGTSLRQLRCALGGRRRIAGVRQSVWTVPHELAALPRAVGPHEADEADFERDERP